MGRVTRLTIATLAQFGDADALPNLVVFSGDARGDRDDNLTVRVSNIGPADQDGPYRVQISRCASDSMSCAVVFDGVRPGQLAAGGVDDITVPWDRVGEAVLFVAVDPENEIVEASEEDNRSFIDVRLVPQKDIAVFPNPFRAGRDPFLAFTGITLAGGDVTISTLSGEPVWTDSEPASPLDQINEVRWRGVNDEGSLVGAGVYIYTIRGPDGSLLRQDKIAVIR